MRGANGEDGNGYEDIFLRTSTASVSVRPNNSWGFDQPRSGWTDAAPNLNSSFPYLWRATRRVEGFPSRGDSIPYSWGEPVIVGRYGPSGADGVAGADGDDGAGVEYVFARTAASVTSISSSQRPLNSWGYDNPQSRGGLAWSDAAPSLTAALDTLWRSERKVAGSPAFDSPVAGSWSTPVIVGRYGPKGDKGDPAALTSAAVKTSHIALSATAEVNTATLGSSGASLTLGGGSGYRYMVWASIRVKSTHGRQGTGSFTIRIRRGSTNVATASVGNLSPGGSSLVFMTADGSHPSGASISISRQGGQFVSMRGIMCVYIAKR